MDIQIFFTGLTMGLSLIVAIGAQNAFVLKQGLARSHVFAVCATCAIADALLITVGVFGFQRISAVMPALDPIMRYAGAAFLNPHVYLDTVVLLGTISTQFPGFEKTFAAGAATGSVLFFFSLGYGARWLRPIFEKPSAWRILEGVIAVTMWAIAFKLVMGA